ncbi:MAG: hypothetical protein ACK40D_15110 [Cyanobacteriota bacterium]
MWSASPMAVAALCYGLASLLTMGFGLVYLTRRQFLPYHQQALGIPWRSLDPALQALLLGLMRTAGGGCLATGVAIACLLLIPFRAGASWVLTAIPAIGLLIALPALQATLLIRRRTGAHTPVAAAAAGVALLVAGALASTQP